MVRFDSVTVQYKEKPIIKNISFSVEENERIALYGKSGSGKSTILTTIVGAHIPVLGTVYFNGEALSSGNILQVRRAVSFIGQEPALGAEMIRDALLLPFSYRINRAKIPQEGRIIETLEKLHLDPDILNRNSSVVSGGEKQRIAIARALLQDKNVFLVDEITSALDIESKKAVLDLFTKGELTLISVSHDPDWFGICSRFIKLEDGEIIDISDEPESIVTSK